MDSPPETLRPVCAKCGGTLRLIGVEAHVSEPGVDTLTFECESCGAYATTEAATGLHARMKRKPAEK